MRQVAIYLAAIAAGALVGWVAPAAAPGLGLAVNPVLAALLYVTFLQVPVRDLARSARDGRFLLAVLLVDFVLAPLVVAALFPLLPADPAVRLGVLLVLLCPCVDYVVVFAGLAGADHRRLLAVTPLLLLAQLVLLPLYLLLFLGPGPAGVVSTGPFLRAFGTLVVLPLGLAWATQTWLPRLRRPLGTTMVPLLALTLFAVVGSQVPRVTGDVAAVAGAVPVYVAYLVVLPLVGLAVARWLRLDVPAGRAVMFTGTTRNSLVVLPLALALPDRLALAAAVVVTQTLIEVIGMLACVRLVPRLLPK